MTPGGAAKSAEEEGRQDRRRDATPPHVAGADATPVAQLDFDRSILLLEPTRPVGPVPGQGLEM